MITSEVTNNVYCKSFDMCIRSFKQMLVQTKSMLISKYAIRIGNDKNFRPFIFIILLQNQIKCIKYP